MLHNSELLLYIKIHAVQFFVVCQCVSQMTALISCWDKKKNIVIHLLVRECVRVCGGRGRGCTGNYVDMPMQCTLYIYSVHTHTSFKDCKPMPMGLKKDIAQSNGLSANLCL